MFHYSRRTFFLIHSAKGVNFTLSSEDALIRIKQRYGSRWFGANLQYLHLYPPKKEFLPFYLASGQVEGVYTGRITYTFSSSTTSSSSSNGNNNNSLSGTENEVVYTKPQTLRTTFSENRTQVYGGFKYHMGHVHSVLRSEQTPLCMEPMPLINTTEATINLFEQSYFCAKDALEAIVKEQVVELARERVKSFHPSASSIDIEFQSLQIRMEALTPVFLPCFVVKALYDGVRYTIYVSGRNGAVGGPYLINALRVARVSSSVSMALCLLLVPNKIFAIWYGMLIAIPLYFLSFFSGKFYPLWRRNWNRRQREKKRLANEAADERRRRFEIRMKKGSECMGEEDFAFSFNQRPNRDTRQQRVKEAYHSSTYWDTHEFEQRRTTTAEDHSFDKRQEQRSPFIPRWLKDLFSSTGVIFRRHKQHTTSTRTRTRSSSSTSEDAKTTKASRSAGGRPFPHYPDDPKGYYRLFGLRGDESINEIRSAYRKVVLQNHPDVGGSTEKMRDINAAYRVLRDPSRRAAYDRETK